LGHGANTRLSRAYMLHLAPLGAKLSWKETAAELSHQLGEGLPGGGATSWVGAGSIGRSGRSSIGVDEIGPTEGP